MTTSTKENNLKTFIELLGEVSNKQKDRDTFKRYYVNDGLYGQFEYILLKNYMAVTERRTYEYNYCLKERNLWVRVYYNDHTNVVEISLSLNTCGIDTGCGLSNQLTPEELNVEYTNLYDKMGIAHLSIKKGEIRIFEVDSQNTQDAQALEYIYKFILAIKENK